MPLAAVWGIGGSLWLSVVFGSTLCVFSVPTGSGSLPPRAELFCIVNKILVVQEISLQ